MSAKQEWAGVLWEAIISEFDLILRELWEGLLDEGTVWLSLKDE